MPEFRSPEAERLARLFGRPKPPPTLPVEFHISEDDEPRSLEIVYEETKPLSPVPPYEPEPEPVQVQTPPPLPVAIPVPPPPPAVVPNPPTLSPLVKRRQALIRAFRAGLIG